MKTILVILEQPEIPATLVTKAVCLANRLGCALRYANTNGIRGDEATNADLLDRIERRLLEQSQPREGFSCDIIVTEDPVAWLSEEVTSTEVVLVIKPRSMEGEESGGAAEWKLIRHLPCPLLLTSDHPWQAEPQVLAAIDIDETDERQQQINALVLAAGREWVSQHQAHLHVAYVIPIARVLEELDIVEEAEVLHKEGDAAESALRSLLERQDTDAESVHIAAGLASARLSALAQKLKIDVLVVGSVGRKGIKGALLGNTAENIIGQVRCDVLVIRP